MTKMLFVVYTKKGYETGLVNYVRDFDENSFTEEGLKAFLEGIKKTQDVDEAIILNMLKL